MTSIWGEKHDKNMAAFDSVVENIENKYFNIFENQVNRLTNEPPDKLTNQFIVQWDSFKYGIAFLKDTYVPQYIQDEVTSAFVKCFSKEN